MKKAIVTKFGFPESRKTIEYEDDECPACQLFGPTLGLGFAEVEYEDGRSDIRRVEVVILEPGINASAEYGFISWTSEPSPAAMCKAVTKEQAEAELKELGVKPWADQ